jgi:guanylate kinase
MKKRHFPLHHVITITTRPRRSSESNNIDYRFVTRDEFLELKAKGELLESANVYGNWYGVPRKDVIESLTAGQDTLIKVDVQGAENIKRILPQAIAVFLAPPSKEDLLTRLRQRSTESTDNLALRLKSAEDEFDRLPMFDYVVVNHDNEIDRAVADIAAIIACEKCRPSDASSLTTS